MDAINPVLRRVLKREDLVYSTDKKPGIFRQKVGVNFSYYDTEGKRIRSDRTIARIENLAIPPAWKNVWISPSPNGYLQATGIDDRKRKQYIYHASWIAVNQENKFSKLVDFGLNLPKIRGKISYEMQKNDLSRARILATVIWLLEHTFIRVGNEEYTKDNNSFGLTTLRNRHVEVRGKEIVFKFRGKSGVENMVELNNSTIARTIKKCIELPGYELFQFIDDSGDRHAVDSKDVNDYLKDLTSNEFTAKDFRTWGATNLSAKGLYRKGAPIDAKVARENVVSTVKEVAKHLNNTVAVCKTYYIHPTVINTYTKNALVPHFNRFAKNKNDRSGLSWNEYALIKLLQKY